MHHHTGVGLAIIGNCQSWCVALSNIQTARIGVGLIVRPTHRGVVSRAYGLVTILHCGATIAGGQKRYANTCRAILFSYTQTTLSSPQSKRFENQFGMLPSLLYQLRL